MTESQSRPADAEEPSPESMDAEIEAPLGFDLSAWEIKAPSPESTERVVGAVMRSFDERRSRSEGNERTVMHVLVAGDLPEGPRPDIQDDGASPILAAARPPLPRAAASRR
jgi:hypothetical protein